MKKILKLVLMVAGEEEVEVVAEEVVDVNGTITTPVEEVVVVVATDVRRLLTTERGVVGVEGIPALDPTVRVSILLPLSLSSCMN